LELPSDTQQPGPQQVQNKFVSYPAASAQLNLLRQNQTSTEYGNLLTLPVAGGLLYVEPVYIERANQDTSFPQLADVFVGFGDQVGFGSRLDDALNQVFPAASAQQSAGTPPLAPTVGGGGAVVPALQQAVSDINSALGQLRTAQQGGDFAGQGNALAALQKAVGEYIAAQNTAPVPPAAPGAAPTVGRSR